MAALAVAHGARVRASRLGAHLWMGGNGTGEGSLSPFCAFDGAATAALSAVMQVYPTMLSPTHHPPTWKTPDRKKRREPPPAATVLMSSWGAWIVTPAVVDSNTCSYDPA